jgi:RNA-binding protein Musashi
MADPNKIFLGGVSFATTEDTLREYLGKYGTITEVVIMKDKFTGQSRGFGFATFTDAEGKALRTHSANPCA